MITGVVITVGGAVVGAFGYGVVRLVGLSIDLAAAFDASADEESDRIFNADEDDEDEG